MNTRCLEPPRRMSHVMSMAPAHSVATIGTSRSGFRGISSTMIACTEMRTQIFMRAHSLSLIAMICLARSLWRALIEVMHGDMSLSEMMVGDLLYCCI